MYVSHSVCDTNKTAAVCLRLAQSSHCVIVLTIIHTSSANLKTAWKLTMVTVNESTHTANH